MVEMGKREGRDKEEKSNPIINKGFKGKN